MKARKVRGLDPGLSLGDALERTVALRLDELCSLAPRALDPRKVRASHDLRIAAKRLRYILEVGAEPCFGPYAATAAKRAKDLQDLLGELHDCDVQLPSVLALAEELRTADAIEARRLGGPADDLDPAKAAGTTHARAFRGLQTLAVFLQARRALLFERFTELWVKLEREGFRARLEYAIGERPVSDMTTSPSQDGDGGVPASPVSSPPATA
jgi:CHAD domain-containing protein